jgi:neutral amino acid transport system ATP-binding protein
MSNPAVIDAYLGAHHDTDLSEEEVSEEALAEIIEEVAAVEAEREGEAAGAPDADAGAEEKK